MRIVFLNRYQDIFERGAEVFVKELSKRLSKNHVVDIFGGSDADSFTKVMDGKYDIVIPVNGRLQSLKVSMGRLMGEYEVLITGHSGVGRDDIWNILVRPDVFVALTNYQLKWAKKWAWGSRLVKIPNGIDLNKFTPNGEKILIDLPRPIILSVGALVWYKFHDRVIKAVSRMDKGSLLIVGEGLLKSELEKQGKNLLGERFKIAKFSYQDMPKVYRSCDLFTLPSWDREAFGIVYLEAMASGLGVVAPDDEAREEIVGDGGLLVDVTDTEKYTETIEHALNLDWSRKARKQAEKFSWEKITKEYESVLLEIFNK